MWTYIIRRLFLMIPTLFGVTVVSFIIMKLAPGDPLLSQLGSGGAASASGQTREAYLIQKRDLQLDKPVLLNFRNFTDYQDELLAAAHFRYSTVEGVEDELAELAAGAKTEPQQRRLAFLSRLHIPDFEANLKSDANRGRLARAIRDYAQVWCEDIGNYAVPDAMQLLTSEDTQLPQKIGLIDCLNHMVVEAHQFTYSRNPTASETPLVQAVWQRWWDINRDSLDSVDPDRQKVLEQQLQTLINAESRTEVFQLLQDEFTYDREDLPFFVQVVLGDAPLNQKVIASMILNLYVANPLDMRVSRTASEDKVDQVIGNWQAHYEPRRARYDKSLGSKVVDIVADTQYAHMVWRLVTFNFGRSALKTREPVAEKLWDAFVVSAPLMLMSQLVIYMVSIPLGITCAVRRNGLADRAISLGLFLLYSVPPFVAGMLFLLFFCYGDYLKWFPMSRLHSNGAEQFGWFRYTVDYLWHAFLPVTCLSLFSLAALAMYSRSAMLDVIGQDYIRTARAKGLPKFRVIYKHALRNALIPVLTLFANFLPALLGGSVLIEFLFNIPGMGRLSWASIEQRDYPTMMALIYVDAIVVLLSILFTDILYVLVDPRISYGGQGKGQ